MPFALEKLSISCGGWGWGGGVGGGVSGGGRGSGRWEEPCSRQGAGRGLAWAVPSFNGHILLPRARPPNPPPHLHVGAAAHDGASAALLAEHQLLGVGVGGGGVMGGGVRKGRGGASVWGVIRGAAGTGGMCCGRNKASAARARRRGSTCRGSCSFTPPPGMPTCAGAGWSGGRVRAARAAGARPPSRSRREAGAAEPLPYSLSIPRHPSCCPPPSQRAPPESSRRWRAAGSAAGGGEGGGAGRGAGARAASAIAGCLRARHAPTRAGRGPGEQPPPRAGCWPPQPRTHHAAVDLGGRAAAGGGGGQPDGWIRRRGAHKLLGSAISGLHLALPPPRPAPNPPPPRPLEHDVEAPLRLLKRVRRRHAGVGAELEGALDLVLAQGEAGDLELGGRGLSAGGPDS
jgi:hypothetical protein